MRIILHLMTQAAIETRPRGRPPLPENQKKRVFTVMLDPDIIDFIEKKSESLGLTQAEIVRAAIRKSIDTESN